MEIEINSLKNSKNVKLLNNTNDRINGEICVFYGSESIKRSALIKDAVELLQMLLKEPVSKHKPIINTIREKYK